MGDQRTCVVVIHRYHLRKICAMHTICILSFPYNQLPCTTIPLTLLSTTPALRKNQQTHLHFHFFGVLLDYTVVRNNSRAGSHKETYRFSGRILSLCFLHRRRLVQSKLLSSLSLLLLFSGKLGRQFTGVPISIDGLAAFGKSRTGQPPLPSSPVSMQAFRLPSFQAIQIWLPSWQESLHLTQEGPYQWAQPFVLFQ